MFTVVGFWYTSVHEVVGDWVYGITWDYTGKQVTGLGRGQETFFRHNLIEQLKRGDHDIREPTPFEADALSKALPFLRSKYGKQVVDNIRG